MAASIDESSDKNDDTGADDSKQEAEIQNNNDQENDEEHDGFEDNILSLNKELSLSKHSFMSSTSDSSEQRKKFIQNLKPNSHIFTEEETTYKPPRRAKPGQKQGKRHKRDVFKYLIS